MAISSSMTIRNVFFIDSRVTGYETLILGLPEGSTWYLLDGGSDGVEQMATVLSNYSGLDSIQIVSHGTEGTLYLGNTILNGSSLNEYATLLSAIGSSLSDTGDLLLYGCNVAAGEIGTQFIESLSLITGADVAASSDITGTNGNWVLEQSTGGQIEAVQIDTAVVLQSFQGNLAALYTRTNPVTFSEDGSTSFQFVLNVAPAFDVQLTVTLAEGLAWSDGTTDPKSFNFTTSDWFNYQTISFKAVDDLDIEGNLEHLLLISLQTQDPTFNAVSEDFTVVVIDNDFQRTLEPWKLPSAGNNAIIYDLVGDAKATTANNTYDLGAGNDWLTVDPSVLGTAKDTQFVGNTGNDALYGVVQALGDAGNDTIETAASGTTFRYSSNGSDYKNNNNLTSIALVRAAGGAGNDVLTATGTVAADLAGGTGSDTLRGAGGNDLLFGDGYESTARYTDQGNGTSSDRATLFWQTGVSLAAGGADSIDGGAGNDTIYGEASDLTTMTGTLSWQDGLPYLTLVNPHTWVGDEVWTAVGVVDGQDIVIPLTLRSFGSNTLSLVTSVSVVEGNGTTILQGSIVLAQAAGETIEVGWNVTGSPTNGVDATDFVGGVLPSGSVTFNRGESVKTFQIQIAGDKTVESDELLSIGLSISNAPMTVITLDADSTQVVVKNDDLLNYAGSALYWKGDIPLNLTTGWAIQDNQSLDTSSTVTLKNVHYDSETRTLTAEVWVNAGSDIQNLDLHFQKPDTAGFTATVADGMQSWSVMQNDRGNQFDIAAIGTTPVRGELKLLDLMISDIDPAQQVLLTRGTVGDISLSATSIFSVSALNIIDGQIQLNAVDGNYSLLDMSAPASSQTLLAIDSRDALMILKMANGSLLPEDMENALQWVAADVDKSGKVNALDAWNELRNLVGLSSSHVGEWQLVNGGVDASTLSAQSAWISDLDKLNLLYGNDIQMVGIIRGDVDGSWAVLG